MLTDAVEEAVFASLRTSPDSVRCGGRRSRGRIGSTGEWGCGWSWRPTKQVGLPWAIKSFVHHLVHFLRVPLYGIFRGAWK